MIVELDELYAKPDLKLLNHLLDVGCIAETLMKYGRAFNMAHSIADKVKLPFPEVVSSISFLCACHDLGKAHPFFMGKMYPKCQENPELDRLWEDFKKRGIVKDGDYDGFRHERFSREILKDYFEEKDFSFEAERFADILAYHHQSKSEGGFSYKVSPDWREVGFALIKEIENEWSFSDRFADLDKFHNGVWYSILSIMVTADWIASGENWQKMPTNSLDRRVWAKNFIQNNALGYIPMKDRLKNVTWDMAFDFEKNELQEKIIEASKSNPSLMIVEYPCGGGKTEASLVAAKQIGANKSGIYLATPTMATAKGMSLRMNKVAQKIGLGMNIPELDSSEIWTDTDMTKIPQYLWTHKTKHHLLYPYAVGTVDQILKTVLYQKYSCIGLIGLSDKVIVIDEVHAYDSYMIAEIKMLIQWCRFLDIPVILLSATLPSVTKRELLEASGCTRDQFVKNDAYPLITTFSVANGMAFTEVSCDERTFNIDVIETDDYEETWNKFMATNYNGCTAYIESTVDKTWRLYDEAKKIGLPNVMMFNGRDTVEHKEKKTKDIIDILGKDRTERPPRLTLTATSIIEQSLDIDLDRMFTAIAPIDLLIQRFGRVWRHPDKDTVREKEHITTPITVIIPRDRFGVSIYSREILARTVSVLKNKKTINNVKDIRGLIDTVYSSLDLTKNLHKDLMAGNCLIKKPTDDNMFEKDYDKFGGSLAVTRFETYPTVSIAVVDMANIADIEHDFSKIKEVMQKCVVTISEYKDDAILAPLKKFEHKLIEDINFYDRQDLLRDGVVLTEDGLRWITTIVP